MRVAFLSNYYNHHQASFSFYMDLLTERNYTFIATTDMEEERRKMGWSNIDIPFYVLKYNDHPVKCAEIIENADVVIWGSAPFEVIKNRLARDKLTLLYSERIHKSGYNYLKLIKHAPVMYKKYGRYKNLYCLCASAFAAFDYATTLTFINKTYKWGYFPPYEKCNDVMEKISSKQSDEISILFVSRLIELKHPELPLLVVKKLKEDNIRVHLTMIGQGELKRKVETIINEYGINNEVTLIDSLAPEEVRKYMDKANIFLFTSDRNEGWGAVMNEAMNSACAVVASSEIGSVPFLIDDKKNGYIYQDGNTDDLYTKVKELCLDKARRESIGMEAYHTIENVWNAETAAKRLLELITDLSAKGESNRFSSGPCSKAVIIKDGWYR